MMAEVIKFYIPDRFQKQSKWIPKEGRGKLIELPKNILAKGRKQHVCSRAEDLQARESASC